MCTSGVRSSECKPCTHASGARDISSVELGFRTIDTGCWGASRKSPLGSRFHTRVSHALEVPDGSSVGRPVRSRGTLQ